jgi:hypothetical protein
LAGELICPLLPERHNVVRCHHGPMVTPAGRSTGQQILVW